MVMTSATTMPIIITICGHPERSAASGGQRKARTQADLNTECDGAVVCPALDSRVGRSAVHTHVDEMKEPDEKTEDEKQPSLVRVLVGLLYH